MKTYVAILVLLMAVSPIAQQEVPKPAPRVQAPSPQPSSRSPQAMCVPPDCDPAAGGQPVNVRVDVLLTEQTEKGAGQPQSVTVILADRALGQTRAAFADRTILVDARPTIVLDLVRISVTIKSEEPPRNFAPGDTLKGPDRFLNWTNSFTVLLQSGKPMVALETADPVTKRKMSIEVKATVQK